LVRIIALEKAEINVGSKVNAPCLCYNATESSYNSNEHCMEIETLLLKLLTELTERKC
jgi:hypothetical protein